MPTINQLLSPDYTPTTPGEFIGPARAAAEIVIRAVRQAKQEGSAPVLFLINGRPGLGKSMLAKFARHTLGCDKWTTTKYNGTQVKIEVLETIAQSLQLTNLFGDYRLLLVEEADKIPPIAQVRFLTICDDLPPGAAVICTSNCKVEDFEERFQTRFQIFELGPPKDAELAGLLRSVSGFNQADRLTPEEVNQISVMAAGNVRAAFKDAQTAFQSRMSLDQAA